MCRTLDKAGVPTDQKWRTLILYMRSLREYTTLTDSQKSAIQNLVLEALRKKEFTDAEFQRIIQRKQDILGEPCNDRLKMALAETMALVEEFSALVTTRKDDVLELGQRTVEALESGADPLELVGKIKASFKAVVDAMEGDVCHLREMSYTDALTGIGNRRAFDECMEEVVRLWQEQTVPSCLVMFDIDHFKDFNDTYGHRIGDHALTVVGRILMTYGEKIAPLLAGPCRAFRYGGEEFAMIFQNASQEQVLMHADALRSAVKKHPLIIRDPAGGVVDSSRHITVSAGVASLQPYWKSPLVAHLIDAADGALYRAKQAGRDRVVVYTPPPEDPSGTPLS
ncbi:GGDEF domain-containing protein [Megalodesulfovibrio gigas]|nr:GGDEF domain-containing protein [Megalodesulfovibrio gigas]